MKRNDGAILMQLRDDNPDIAYPDNWALPSGGVEEGETVAEAAMRELLEETGYRAKVDDLDLLIQSPQILSRGEVLRSIFILNYDGIQPIECHEGRKMEFIDPNLLPEMKVFADHIKFIKAAEEKFRF